jgi:hypothetical protein
MPDQITLKKSDFRSEIRTIKSQQGNFLAVKFNDGNTLPEFHVYAEVQAKGVAREILTEKGIAFTESENTRTLWNRVWDNL